MVSANRILHLPTAHFGISQFDHLVIAFTTKQSANVPAQALSMVDRSLKANLTRQLVGNHRLKPSYRHSDAEIRRGRLCIYYAEIVLKHYRATTLTALM